MRAFLDGRFPLDVVRDIEHAGARLDRERWHELGETGVFSLRLPEADGGLGLGVSEAVLVFEELGRALVPGPLVATQLAARISPRRAAGHDRRRAGRARRRPVVVVEHPDDLDVLLVLDDDGVRRRRSRRDRRRRRRRARSTRSPRCGSSTGALPDGELLGGRRGRRAAPRATGSCSRAASSSASPSRTVELATAYAKEREQFGRPIGSFQAVKHLIADMLVRAEVARAAVYAAACALDGRSDDDPARAAAVAKVMAGEAALANAQDVHPGARRHRVHVGGRRAALLEARRGARHALRQQRRVRRSRRRDDLTEDAHGIRTMKFTTPIAMIDPSFYIPLAQAAEEIGFDSIAVPDSIAYPRESSSKYPYNPDGTREFLENKPFIETMTAIAAMGAATERIEFHTFVLKMPMRHPVVLAKEATSIAVLTGNRLVLGVGTSPWPDDYEIVGLPWERRGRRFDECIEIVRGLGAGGYFEYHGEFYEFPAIKLNPVPSQPVPILIGGHSDANLRRAARRSMAGWQPVVRPKTSRGGSAASKSFDASTGVMRNRSTSTPRASTRSAPTASSGSRISA